MLPAALQPAVERVRAKYGPELPLGAPDVVEQLQDLPQVGWGLLELAVMVSLVPLATAAASRGPGLQARHTAGLMDVARDGLLKEAVTAFGRVRPGRPRCLSTTSRSPDRAIAF